MYSSWTEWYSLCYNAIKPYLSDDMDINNMDMDEFVEYMKTSPEMKAYFSDLIRLVDCCNPAVATGSGAENWLTEDNDIAINFDVNGHTKTYMQYVYADDTEMTDRYKALLIPTGDAGEDSRNSSVLQLQTIQSTAMLHGMLSNSLQQTKKSLTSTLKIMHMTNYPA